MGITFLNSYPASLQNAVSLIMLYTLLTVLRKSLLLRMLILILVLFCHIAKEENWDRFCKHILNLLASKKLQPRKPYYLDNGTLIKYIHDVKQTYEGTILPHSLPGEVLRLAHDILGHNGSTRTYMMIKGCIIGKG